MPTPKLIKDAEASTLKRGRLRLSPVVYFTVHMCRLRRFLPPSPSSTLPMTSFKTAKHDFTSSQRWHACYGLRTKIRQHREALDSEAGCVAAGCDSVSTTQHLRRHIGQLAAKATRMAKIEPSWIVWARRPKKPAEHLTSRRIVTNRILLLLLPMVPAPP